MKRYLLELRRAILEDWQIVAGATVVWATLIALLASKGVDGLIPSSYEKNLLLYLVTLLVMVLAVLIRKFREVRPESPIRFVIQLLAQGEWARRLARGAPLLVALVVFMPAFSAIKSSIPLFSSQNWDSTWIAADHLIHGADPWRLLQPLLGFPIVTSAFSFAYFAWFFVIYAASIYFCFLSNDRELRARYFISYFACWTICGVILAVMFESVGPFLVGPLLGDARFDEQLAYLRMANEHFPVLTLRAREFLLTSRLESSSGLGAGISAMPSMHVSMALLVALSTSRISRTVAVAGFAFFAAILVGSVHLGPHYAVDGYTSIAVTLVAWAVAGRLARIMTRLADIEAMPSPGPRAGIATA